MMMEGETLLENLKDGGKMDSLLIGIERFYSPISRSTSKLTSSIANKYGVFAMKALRACIERLTVAKPGSQDLAGILQITEQSYQCVCKARKHIKTVPLALEKFLFHTMAQTLNKRLLSDALRIASFLYDELSKSRSEFLTGAGVDNEYDTIVKQAFNQLWKACLELEQSSQHAIKHTLILNVRLQALQFLMLTDYECQWVVERALRAALDFDRKSSKAGRDQDQLHTFLTTVLGLLLGKDSKVMKVKDNIDKLAGPLFELGLPAIKYGIRASKYEQALEVCSTLSDFLHNSGSKGCIKEDDCHSQCLVLIQSALQYKQHMHSTKSGKNKSNHATMLDSFSDSIQTITASISKALEKSSVSGTKLSNLLEACEILKKSLEGPTDPQKQKEKTNSALLPVVLHDPVYGVMMMYVDLLQVQREQLAKTSKGSKEAAKSHNQQMQRNVNRQLGTLDFLSTMMLGPIKTSGQDEATDSEGCLARAVKICNRTKGIIDDVATGGGGSLSTEENRWFGSNAYNVGLVCYKKKYYNQSAILLEIACNQLQTWCFTGNKLDMAKLKKVQLISRYELLIDCQRKAGQNLQAMKTVVKCLWEVCSHVTDHVTPCIELWVKAKRDALKDEESDELQSRTLFDAIKDIKGVSLDDDHRDYITLLLKKELQSYKSARHDTLVEQHSAVCDLLNLNSSDDTKLAYCHALVEQAQMLRVGNFESDKSASECCSEAIDVLTKMAENESTSSNGGQGLLAFDILGTAYFWMYVCQMEDIQVSTGLAQICDNAGQGLLAFDILGTAYFWMYVCQMEDIQLRNAKPPESPADDTKPSSSTGGIISHVAYTLGMEHSNMQYLDMALGIWGDLLCNGFKPDVFHDMSATSQCLKLMASLYELTQKPMQQLQSLHLLSVLSTASGNTSQSLYAFCQISSTLCQLGETKLAGNIMRKAEDILEQVDGGPEDAGRKSLDLTCMLAKAQYLLYSGQFDKFRSKWEKLVQSQTSERRTYHTYLQNASIKQLQAICMDINPEVMTLADLCPEGSTALDLAVEAKQIRMGVCSNLLGEYFCNSREQADGSKANASMMDSNCQEDWYDQWSILSAVLQSLLQVGKIYCRQGCAREAECYLHEGLIISNQYLLPRRCAEFCLQLSKVCTMRGQQCQVQLTQMKQFVDETTKETKAMHKTKHTAITKKKGARRISYRPSFADSDDENFIQSKRLSLTDILSDDDVTSSPSLKSQTIKLPGYHKHAADCECESCYDVVLHGLDLEYFVAQARSSAMQGDFVEALSELDMTMKFSIWITNHDEAIMQGALKTLVDLQKESSKKNKNCKSVDNSPVLASVHDHGKLQLQTLKARILLQQNKAVRAQQCIDTGLAMFSKDLSPVLLPLVGKAELQFYQIMANAAAQQSCDMFATVWKDHQNQTSEPHLLDVDDLTSKVGKLDLNEMKPGAKCTNTSRGWQDRLKDAGRPELAREDLVTPAAQMITSKGIGIFCDLSDNEDGDTKGGASAIINTPKPVRPKSAAMKVSSKKGVFSYSMKKTKSTKKVVEKESNSTKEPMSVYCLDNDVFDFNSPSATAKKSKSTRKAKSARSVASKSTKLKQKSDAKVTFSVFDDGDQLGDEKIDSSKNDKKNLSVIPLEKDEHLKQDGSKSHHKRKTSKLLEAVDDSKLETGGKSTTKRSTAAKSRRKPPVELSDTDGEQEPKDVPDVKPKGRGRRKMNTTADDAEGVSSIENTATKKPTRQRRGRKANIENARADDDELGLDSFKMVMESTGILPIDTPEDLSDVSGTYDDLDLSPNATKDTSSSHCDSVSTSPVAISISSAVSDMLLEDIDEIEIPRAGPESDTEDVSMRRKRTASKKTTGRRRVKKKAKESDDEEEDGVEMMRTATCGSDDLKSKQKKKMAASTGKMQNVLYDSDLSPIIEQLEHVYNIIKQSAPVVLYRQVCHMLALCYGDQAPHKAVYYLNEAMAVTLRHKKLASLKRKIKKLRKESANSDVDQLSNNLSKMSLIPDNDKNQKKSASSSSGKQKPASELEILEDEKKMFAFCDESRIVEETVNALPQGWTVCMLSIASPSVCSNKIPIESDFLVVSRITQGKEPILHKIPMHKNDFGFSKSTQAILTEFDAILLENKESVKETDKKVWWTCRQKLDERMEALTKDMESLLGCWKGILLGQKKHPDQRKQLAQGVKEFKTALESSCQVTMDEHLCECVLASANYLSNQQLSTAISCLSGFKPGSVEHTELIAAFKQIAAKLSSNGAEKADTRHPVILVLDKQIQQLPWENMPVVRDQPMCRMPSLHFISSHLNMASQSTDSVLSHGVDTTDTFFVLNPTNDLANTQKTFQKWFEKENGWQGVVARAPTKEEYMSALTDHDLFVYCGHGNGREFLTGDDIQKLTCQAATMLIGCSSGKLHVNGMLEAYGMTLNYLVSGCPCVVANLWDVTDKDIDRFLEELLKSWLASDKTSSLSDYISQSRHACKLQYLIGCSPVVYGLPVHIKK
ncbi:LOW QUALITY PROTEIN: separin-like [Amphiura filiformis]|uniref:LOW QUALITY PROTEIN: separin-like n=1 Tax=Amphiura filiformis TaxID=82378 RepID=UPI003B222A39